MVIGILTSPTFTNFFFLRDAVEPYRFRGEKKFTHALEKIVTHGEDRWATQYGSVYRLPCESLDSIRAVFEQASVVFACSDEIDEQLLHLAVEYGVTLVCGSR